MKRLKKEQKKQDQRQEGNVLFIVLIAISLLVALTISLTSSERFSNSMDNERVVFELQEIYQYAQSLERAISHVMLNNGCEILQLNFDHPDRVNYNTAGHYLNSNSPVDMSCHIFEPEGGGVIYSVPPSMSRREGSTEYGIIGGFDIETIGTNQAELLLYTRVSEEMCFKINNDQGIENTDGNLPERSITLGIPYSPFFSYPSSNPTQDDNFRGMGSLGISTHTQLLGHKVGCFRSLSGNRYEMYYVLIVR